jgi:2-dehydropantoate 2-reductase
MIQQQGLSLKQAGGNAECKPDVRLLTDMEPQKADILIVTVKSYHVESIIPYIKTLFTNTRSVLFIQNGMTHIQYLPQLQDHSIYLGVVEHGAMRASDACVSHTGIGRTKVAPYVDGHAGINWEGLKSEAFPFILENDWYAMLSRKLHINSVINPLTALFNVKNGRLLEVPQWTELMRGLSREACNVLRINRMEAWEDLVQVCQNTSKNTSSMLRDLEQGRQTEMDAINGYLVQLAKQDNINVPNHEFVFRAVKGLELLKGRGDRNG